jgi:hypothetical protein
MTERVDQRICIKFCFKLGHSSADTIPIIKVFGDDSMSETQLRTFTKGAKLLIATDSNSRFTAWHDTTNNRGRMMEDYVANKQMHIINEERTLTTFQSSRGESNIDLTIADNKMIANIQKWDISEEESASGHNIIKFNITLDKAEGIVLNDPGQRLRIKEQQYTEFSRNFKQCFRDISNRGQR